MIKLKNENIKRLNRHELIKSPLSWITHSNMDMIYDRIINLLDHKQYFISSCIMIQQDLPFIPMSLNWE